MSRSSILVRVAYISHVHRDVHPSAFISRLYVENQLCSAPITSPHGHTDNGIRVTLGDLGSYLLFL